MKFLNFWQIEHLLNGYARMVFYQVYGKNHTFGYEEYSPFVDPKLNKMTDLKEGQFSNGIPDGFARIIDVHTYVGYYKQGKVYGKH
jgi:hypothetical protein